MIKRNTIRVSIIAVFTCCIGFVATAQEAVFAQYYASPMHLNPAMVGVFNGQYRLNANYRQQWGAIFSDAPIRTFHAAFDYRTRVTRSDYFAFGINAINDETGSAARVKTTKGNLGVAFQKQLGGGRYRNQSNYLSAGLQVGLGQNSLNMNNLWFDRQYDSIAVAVNTSLASGELTPQSNMYVDYNLGLLFYTVWENNRSFYVGGSLHHITRPNVSFFGDTKETIRRRITFHGGGEIPINKELSILPSALITLQGPAMWAMAGANFRYTNHDWNEAAVRVGASFRLANKYISALNKEGKSVQTGTGIIGDAFTLTGVLEINRLLIGASYDLHTSSIKTPTNARGAWELSLIYTGAEKRRVNTSCPHF